MPSHSDSKAKYNMALAHLYRLVPLMTEEQQIELLKYAKRMLTENKPVKKAQKMKPPAAKKIPAPPPEKAPVKTPAPTPAKTQKKDKRASIRKSCFLSVDFVTQDRSYTSFIRSLGSGGVFIESREAFFPGDGIAMNFSLTNHPTPFKISGEIAWCGPEGIGVEFKSMGKYQSEILASLIVQMESEHAKSIGRVSFGKAPKAAQGNDG
ncbi:MAG: hypothetical protein GY859_06435 [Desulfobacterales bacterium]|nr:hypothetical protein [Desulfobacterales bacterium]